MHQVLAGHLVIHSKREPSHRPVGLPLQLGATAADESRNALLALGILVGDRAGISIMRQDRDLQHRARSGRSDGSMIDMTVSKRRSTSSSARSKRPDM